MVGLIDSRANATGRGTIALVLTTVLLFFTAASLRTASALQLESGSATLELLRSWITVVERHVPGQSDAPLAEAQAWAESDLATMRGQIGALFIVLSNPNIRRISSVSQPSKYPFLAVPSRHRGLVLEGPALDELRRLALHVRGAGLDRFLKRAVVLHTDVRVLRAFESEVIQASEPSSTFRVHLDDSRLAGFSDSSAHWELARTIAGQIGGGPSGDPWVLTWYQATAAFLIGEQQYATAQLQNAIRLYPKDPPLLMLAAAEREALSSPLVQVFLQTQARDANVKVPVQSAADELSASERLLLRALESDPGFTEARVRLAHVALLRGNHDDAVRHLRVALHRGTEPLLDYYANLFLGTALQRADDYPGARQAYQKAAALFPRAQSVNLALARLAWLTGEREQLRSRLSAALSAADEQTGEDPWTHYYVTAGRKAEALLNSVREPILRGAR